MNLTSATNAHKDEARYSGLPWAVLFVVAYFIFQMFWVTIISNGAGLDDAEQLANSSYFDWGYGGSQPPLYTWIVSLVSSVIGTSLFTLQVVKFGVLASLFLSVFTGLRLLGFSVSVASAGMLGLFLIPQIGWESQRALTHSVAGTAACGWAFCAFAWYMRSPRILSASLFGATMVAAILGKFNATIFIVMLFVTSFTIYEYRQIIISKLSFVTLTTFIICISPTALWMLENRSSVLARSQKLQIGVSGDPIMDRINGLESLFIAAILFSALVLVIAGIIALLHYRTRTKIHDTLNPGEKFMRRIVVAGFLLVMAGVLITGMNDIKDRWLQPVLFLLPAALACQFSIYRANSQALRDFALIGGVAAIAVPPILGYYLTYGSSMPPYGQLDYAKLYDEIRSKGEFTTIVSDKPQISGNFRLFNSDIGVIHNETPFDAVEFNKPALIMWFGDAPAQETIPELLNGLQITPPDTGFETTTIAYKTNPELFMTVSYFHLN